MLIATIVFGPFAGAAAAAAIGKKSEKAGEYAALFLTLCVLGLSLALVPLAGTATLYPSAEGAVGASFVIPGILSGSGLTFCVTGFRAVYAVITAIMWVVLPTRRKTWEGTSFSCCLRWELLRASCSRQT